MSTAPARLIVFAGLPGVGKTAIGRAVADRLAVTFLRVDTVEAAIASTLAPIGDSPVGYFVAARVAADQLRSGRSVVVDAVNNVEPARDGWLSVAREFGAALRFVEVICSDAAQHRQRVETREAEMPGHAVPSWHEVQIRPWEPFTQDRLLVDNVGDPERHVAAVLAWLSG